MFLHTVAIYSILEQKSIFTLAHAMWCRNILEQNERCILIVEASSFETSSGLLLYHFFFLRNYNSLNIERLNINASHCTSNNYKTVQRFLIVNITK